jgi:hypothetical protein
MSQSPDPQSLEDRIAEKTNARLARLTAAHLKLSGWHSSGPPSFAHGLVHFADDAGRTATYREDERGRLVEITKPIPDELLRLLDSLLSFESQISKMRTVQLTVLTELAASLISKGFSLTEAGAVLGYTKQRIHQLVGSKAKALEIAGAL